MDFWFPGHNAGIDLNEPAYEEGAPDQNMAPDDPTGQAEEVTGNDHGSGNNTGASADTGVDSGDTISSDDSGGEEEVQSTPGLTPMQKPFPEQLFNTWEEARQYYNRYAKHVGFSIKSSTSRNSTKDKQRDKCLFVCNKSGKNVDISKQEVPPVRQCNRSITKKTDCRARLRVKRRGQKWHVTMFIEDHNHPCLRKFSLKRFLRSHKGIPKEEREFVKLLHKVNLSAGRVMSIMAELYGKLANVPYERKDVSNYMATLDTAAQTNNDMTLLLAKFDKMKQDDPDFFYKIDLDHDDRNAQGVLGNDMAQNEPLRLEFNATIDHSMTVEEFESRWADMILKYNVADNKHLQDLYDIRTSFVPAYFKDRFFPFLQTTARSEGFNAVLKRYISPRNSLLHFFEQYLKLQEKIDVAEDSNEFQVEDKILRLWGEWPLEEHAFNVYTRPIYLRFRAKIRKVTSYNANHLEGQLFDVVPIAGSVFGYGRRSYRVVANVEDEMYNCECSKITRDGLLCCHVLRVMQQLGVVQSIPEHYILPRWTMPPDDILPETVELPEVPLDRKMSNKERKLLRYGTLCNDWTAYAKVAAESEKGKALADKYMRELGKELSAMKITAAAKRKEKKKCTKNQADTYGDASVGDDGQGSSSKYQHVRDPIITTTKGRPEEKRKKSGLHLKPSKNVKCKSCGSAQHKTTECPSKIIPDPEPQEINFFRDMI
ncbi:hypothetical protein ACQ4PT_016197 [Festuca glaucescens]